MKKKIFYFLAIMFMLFSSCKDKNTYDPTSLTGAWQCRESGSISQPRNYQVLIEKSTYDSSIYIVNNFYKTGYETEIWFSVNDSLIDIQLQSINSYYSFTGHGTISADYKRIELEYEANIPEGIDEVTAIYSR